MSKMAKETIMMATESMMTTDAETPITDKIQSVFCRKKSITFDGKPYRMEIWGTQKLGVLKASLPLYFASFETENDCEKAAELVKTFLHQYNLLRKTPKV